MNEFDKRADAEEKFMMQDWKNSAIGKTISKNMMKVNKMVMDTWNMI